MKNYTMLLLLALGFMRINAGSFAPDEQPATHSFRVEDTEAKRKALEVYNRGGKKCHILESRETLGPDSGGEDRIVCD